jgi:molecular chaperone DnaK
VAEKTLKDAGDKAKKEDKEKVEAEIKNLRETLAKSNVTKEQLEEASKKLSEVLQQVGAAMYQQAQPPPGSPPAGEEKKEEPKKPDKDKAEEGEVVE